MCIRTRSPLYSTNIGFITHSLLLSSTLLAVLSWVPFSNNSKAIHNLHQILVKHRAHAVFVAYGQAAFLVIE